MGHKPSYTWRSILAGREILERGVRWRVGDGSSITLGSGPINGFLSHPPFVLSPPEGASLGTQLCRILSFGCLELGGDFLPVDMERIGQISPCLTGKRDERKQEEEKKEARAPS